MGKCVMRTIRSCTTIAQAELGQQPEQSAGRENLPPATPDRRRKHQRREEEKGDIHRQNVQQRRAIEQQDRADDRDERMRE